MQRNVPLPSSIGSPLLLSQPACPTKSVHRRFQEFSDAELKQIRVLSEGLRLEQGATYLNLANLELGEFTVTGEMSAGPHYRIVAKQKVPYELWHRLIGVEMPE